MGFILRFYGHLPSTMPRPYLPHRNRDGSLAGHGLNAWLDERRVLGAFKDFEFSRATMAARWKQGLSDVLVALQASPWLAPMPKELGVRVFDVMHEILTGRPEPV